MGVIGGDPGVNRGEELTGKNNPRADMIFFYTLTNWYKIHLKSVNNPKTKFVYSLKCCV